MDLLRVGGTDLLAPLLPVADALDDAELAYALLARLSVEGLTAARATALAAVVTRYGDAWTRRNRDASSENHCRSGCASCDAPVGAKLKTPLGAGLRPAVKTAGRSSPFG